MKLSKFEVKNHVYKDAKHTKEWDAQKRQNKKNKKTKKALYYSLNTQY